MKCILLTTRGNEIAALAELRPGTSWDGAVRHNVHLSSIDTKEVFRKSV